MTDWRKLLTDEHLWDYRCKAVPVPLVREIVEEVETLRQDLAAARARNKECDLLLSRVLHELAGPASLCWEPKPTGVFATELALGFVEDAIKELRAALAGQRREGEGE